MPNHKRGNHISTRVQSMKILEMKSNGMSHKEISEALDVSIMTVSRAINSNQSKEILANVRTRLEGLLGNAVDVYQHAVQNPSLDMSNALKAAKDILKNSGVLRDQVEVAHTFPKPTIIRRVDGTEVILGVAPQIEGDEGV